MRPAETELAKALSAAKLKLPKLICPLQTKLAKALSAAELQLAKLAGSLQTKLAKIGRTLQTKLAKGLRARKCVRVDPLRPLQADIGELTSLAQLQLSESKRSALIKLRERKRRRLLPRPLGVEVLERRLRRLVGELPIQILNGEALRVDRRGSAYAETAAKLRGQCRLNTRREVLRDRLLRRRDRLSQERIALQESALARFLELLEAGVRADVAETAKAQAGKLARPEATQCRRVETA